MATTKTTQPKYTGTSVSKAGNVNYGISGDVLKAYGASQAPIPDATQYADAGVKQVSEYFKQKDQVKKEAENTWDESFDAIGYRQSWASPELYDQFKADVSAQREEYIAAIQRGDKAGADKILSNLNSKSANVQTWKKIIETSTNINDSDYFMPAGDMDPNDRHIMGIINKQTPGTFTYVNDPETGEGVFNIEMKDGSIRKVTQRDYESMITKNMKPLEVEKSFTESNNEIASSISKNKVITKITPDSKDYSTMLINNERLIKEENYSNLWKYDFTKSGKSPLEILADHKDFDGIDLSNTDITGLDLKSLEFTYQGGEKDAQGNPTKGRGYWQYTTTNDKGEKIKDPTIFYDGLKFNTEAELEAHRKKIGDEGEFEPTEIEGSRKYYGNNDGFLQANEIAKLDERQKDIILNEISKVENYDIGKSYLSEIMTYVQVSGANQLIGENLAKEDKDFSGFNPQ